MFLTKKHHPANYNKVIELLMNLVFGEAR